jgi:hypothetical protein
MTPGHLREAGIYFFRIDEHRIIYLAGRIAGEAVNNGGIIFFQFQLLI